VIRFIASEPHYRDHLYPVALEVSQRGITVEVTERNLVRPAALTVVASWKDYQDSTGPVVFFEHGAGFTYQTRNHSYAGGPGRDRVVAFACVNERVAAANRAAYPDVPSIVVGSPVLDRYLQQPKPVGPPVVAFSWHWDCRVAPETRSAFPHYRRHLKDLAGDWTPLGHAHPRAWSMVRGTYLGLGWEIAETFAEVVARASVYVCDTSSTIYEFAALDRPVIVLNSPDYRRDVEHGLRFWQDIPGIQVDEPGDLTRAIQEALTRDEWADRRRDTIGRVYPHLGAATALSADVVIAQL
jgi:hypothetical protein